MNDESNSPTDNPFSAPPGMPSHPGMPMPGGPVIQGANYVRQVNIVAILLILHGILLLLAGGGMTFLGGFFVMTPEVFNGSNNYKIEVNAGDDEDETGGGEVDSAGDDEGAAEVSSESSLKLGDDGDSDTGGEGISSGEEAIANFMGIFYGGIGVVLLLIGILQIYAGIRNISFKSRNLGIAALSVGIVSAFTCWCAPTSIGLAIYGLVVYLSPAVTHAFELRKEGLSKEDVLARFPV